MKARSPDDSKTASLARGGALGPGAKGSRREPFLQKAVSKKGTITQRQADKAVRVLLSETRKT